MSKFLDQFIDYKEEEPEKTNKFLDQFIDYKEEESTTIKKEPSYFKEQLLQQKEIGGPQSDLKRAFSTIEKVRNTIAHKVFEIQKRGLGIGFGTLNVPHAFLLGALKESREYAKEHPVTYEDILKDKEPLLKWRTPKPFAQQQWQQEEPTPGIEPILDQKKEEHLWPTLEAGWRSACASVIKKGEWGVGVNELYKTCTGKTIKEALPEKYKWAAIPIEMGAEILTDPIMFLGLARSPKATYQMAVKIKALKHIPEGFAKELPEEIITKIRTGTKLTTKEDKILIKKINTYVKYIKKLTPKERDKITNLFSSQNLEKEITSLTPELRTRFDELHEYYYKAWKNITSFEEFPNITEVGKENYLRSVANYSAMNDLETKINMPILNDITEKLIIAKKITEYNKTKLKSMGFTDEVINKMSPEEAQVIIEGKKRRLWTLMGDQPTEARGSKILRDVQEALERKEMPQGEESIFKGEGIPEESIYKVPPEDVFVVEEELPGKVKGVGELTNGELRAHADEIPPGPEPKGEFVLPDGTVITEEAPASKYNKLYTQEGKAKPKVEAIKVPKEYKGYDALTKVHQMQGKTVKNWRGSMGILKNTLRKTVWDRLGYLKEVSPEAYREARLFPSYADVADLKFKDLQESFKNLRGVRKEPELVTNYINAHRALTRAERGLKNPGGVTKVDAQKAIEQAEALWTKKGYAVKNLKQAMREWQDWTRKNILDEFHKEGFLSDAAYNKIIANNDWYAAYSVLEKMPDDMDKIPVLKAKEYFSAENQDVIRRMKGTEKLIADPIEATIKKFGRAQELMARNRVASTLIDDILRVGKDGEIPIEIKRNYRPVVRSRENLKAMQEEFDEMASKGLNPIKEGTWDKKEYGTISRFKDGKVETYIAPIEIVDVMKQLTPWNAPKYLKFFNDLFRKSATTLYLPFTITNAFRDALLAWSTSPVYKGWSFFKFVPDWFKGAKEGFKYVIGKSKLVEEEYLRYGGGFGYTGVVKEPKHLKGKLFMPVGIKSKVRHLADPITLPLKVIEKISEVIELAPRLAVFKRAKLLGYEGKDAAILARQATIDFNRGGTLTKVLNQYVPFLNARVQARVVMGEALQKNTAATLSKIAALTVPPGITSYAINRLYFSDLYDDIPDYVKQSNYCIIYGSKVDERTKRTVPRYITISKGDIGAIGWNAIEFALDKAWKKDKQGTAAFLVDQLSNLSPVEFSTNGKISGYKALGGLLPPIVRAGVEDWANLKFYYGTPIVPRYLEKKPPELQYREITPEAYKWIGEKLGVSPLRLQNYAGNIVAAYGREGLSPSAIWRSLTGRLVKSTGGAIEDKAWTTINDIERSYNYARAYAEELVKDGNKKAAVKLLVEWNRGFKKQIDAFNKEFSKYGFHEKSGLRKSYIFTSAKISNIVRRKPEKRTPIERKLYPRNK